MPLSPTIEFWVSIDALKAYQFLSAIPFVALLMVGCAFTVSLPLIDPVMNEDIGWLLVGSRPDGSICNRDERAALAAVAPQIARSIATVQAMDRRMAG